MKKTLLAILALFAGLTTLAQTPEADVLNVVFNDDGSVVDASAMANPVVVMGSPDIKKSTRYGMNVLCLEEEKWGAESMNNIRFPYNDNLVAAVSDGMTMEVLVRPYFQNGTMDNEWVNIFGGYQGGGFGIIIYNGVWDFECVIGGGYKDATYGPVVDGQWIHLTGVWDKEAGQCKLYANGELVSTVGDAGGELGFPSYGDLLPFVGVGVDFEPASNSLASNTFQGDIAIARIYNKPLSDDEVKAIYSEIDAKKVEADEHEEGSMPALRTDEDGTVLIANAEELDNFGRAVRLGHTSLDAKLEADVDYSAARKSLSNIRSYNGTFNGQGHTVKLAFNSIAPNVSLFQNVTDGTIRNLNVTGTINTCQKYASSVVACTDGNARLENVSSDVMITSTLEGDGTHGGLVGHCTNGLLSIDNCLYTGTIQSETTSCCAGFVGWSGSETQVSNSLMLGEVNVLEEGCALFSRNLGNVTVTNSYYLQPYGDINQGATLCNAEQLSSGEICWQLNGATASKAVWRQNFNEDEHPVLDQTHGMVIEIDGVYLCIKDEASLKDACSQYSAKLLVKADEYEVYQPLLDALRTHAQELNACTSLDEFIAKCSEIDSDIALIEENVTAYASLISAADAAFGKLEGLTGYYAIMLRSYLEEDIEPNDNYPNGSCSYIINNLTLGTEEVNKEILFLDDLLLKAMSSGTPAGSDVTMLVQNPDFAKRAEGWEGSVPTDFTASPYPPGTHYWGNNDVICYQTITGLSNGVYEVDMNAFNMIGDDSYCNFYTAFVFANDMTMPVMGPMEDALSVDDAVEDVNCHSSDRFVDDQYRIPYSRNGGTIAMIRGGRYLNRVLVNVTDGTLKLGLRLDGSGRNDDWVVFTNTKLYYQGTTEEATESLDNVMKCAVARATSLINLIADSQGNNYTIYPNYPVSLRDALIQAVTDVGTAATGEEKYALISRFSDLFKQIYQGCKAYIQCAKDIEAFGVRVDDYPEYADELMDMYDDAWQGWTDGRFSTEEALNVGPNLMEKLDKYQVEIPAADLMDIVFAADGTATDASATQNVVEAMGTPRVVASPALNMNVFCGADNPWGEDPKNNYVVLVSDALKAGIEDGVTMEVLARPYWESGDVPGNWCTLFGSEEGGGMGMLVYNRQWCFEVHAGGGYRDAFSGFAPVNSEWTHLVGVWDGSEAKLFVNGNLVGSVSASGSYGWPGNVLRQWFGIGCDLSPEDKGQASFTGDIAIARLYNEPMNPSQVNKLYKTTTAIITDTPEHMEGGDAIGSVLESHSADKGIYDLTGRKVSRTDRKGIYIINGKKVVIR
ncbi:MAG: LamG-like jellyroll fold domain-containing protein [Bacteroidaceae bacterium]